MILDIKWDIRQGNIIGDSQLIIKHVNNEYKVTDEKYIPFKKLVDTMKDFFEKIMFQ